MNKLKKNMIVLFIVISMIFGITFPVFGNEETINYSKTGKEENVYVNLKNDGSIKDIYVVNQFLLNEKGNITDYGDYSEVRNLSSSDKITKTENTINFNGVKGKNYYQGKLNSQNIPWNISVKYFLDGNEVSSEDILGKSGKAEIKINITKNPNVNETFFENFLLQTTLSLNTDKCKNIETTGATIANNGENKQLTYMILAGEEKEISIKFDTSEFELKDGISFNGVLMSLVIDSLDTTEVTNKVSELSNAVSKLNDGANTLKSGSSTFKSSLGNLNSSVVSLPGGSASVKNGINTALTGLKTIRANLNVQGNSSSDAEAIKSQVMAQISSTLQTEPYASMIATNPELLPVLQGLLEQAVTNTANTVSSSYNQKINSTMTNLSTALSDLENGLATISNSYRNLDSGINTVVSSIGALNSAYANIDNGINEISSGTSQMNSETENLDSNVENKIDEVLDGFENSNYQVISFVSEQNTNMNSVQFVIKTEGIKIKEEQKIEQEDKKEQSFVEKFVNLFK